MLWTGAVTVAVSFRGSRHRAEFRAATGDRSGAAATSPAAAAREPGLDRRPPRTACSRRSTRRSKVSSPSAAFSGGTNCSLIVTSTAAGVAPIASRNACDAPKSRAACAASRPARRRRRRAPGGTRRRDALVAALLRQLERRRRRASPPPAMSPSKSASRPRLIERDRHAPGVAELARQRDALPRSSDVACSVSPRVSSARPSVSTEFAISRLSPSSRRRARLCSYSSFAAASSPSSAAISARMFSAPDWTSLSPMLARELERLRRRARARARRAQSRSCRRS